MSEKMDEQLKLAMEHTIEQIGPDEKQTDAIWRGVQAKAQQKEKKFPVFRVAAAAVFVLVWKMEIEALPYSYAVGWVVMLLYELPMLVRYLRSHGDEL